MTSKVTRAAHRRRLVYREAIDEEKLHGLAGNNSVKQTHMGRPSQQNHTILKGHINSRDCQSRLNVHVTDSVEVRDYEARAFLQPAVTISLILKGKVEGTIGGQAFVLDAQDGPSGYIWSMNEQAPWTRSIHKDMHVRKVNISVDRNWLLEEMQRSQTQDPLYSYLHRLMHGPLEVQRWHPSYRALSLAEQILQPDDGFAILEQIHLESRALELICEAFSTLSGSTRVCETSDQSARAQMVRDFVEDRLEDELSLAMIARELGMAVNSMQRIFKAAYDMTVMDYIRERRLEIAKNAMVCDGLTIAQAAFKAGYKSSANFATAFKRVYGVSPSSLRD